MLPSNIKIKNYKILIPNSVKIALQKQADYIAFEQQNPITANNWLDGIIHAIQSLSKLPDRCPVAPENSYIKKDSTIIIQTNSGERF